MTRNLSGRGRSLLATPPIPAYVREHFERIGEGYDASANPGGYIGLCIAENKQVGDLLLPRLGAAHAVPASVLGYDSMVGAIGFREQLARFMGKHILGREFEPGQLAVLAGAGSVLEVLFFALADPGDGVLVPTPSYAGFWPDLQLRDGLCVVPVHGASAEEFSLTPSGLEAAMARAEVPVKALLLASPGNPRGEVYSRAELNDIVAWAQGANIHVVFDEIFALSVHGNRPFVSGAAVRPSLGDQRHIVWAFSKDFGASGLRCGVLVTENEEVYQAVESLSYWACCSGLTQHLLCQMISDEPWAEGYVTTMRGRLRASYAGVTGALDQAQIPYLPAQAGFFLLCDLRRHLQASSWDAEHVLWRRMIDEVNVNLTPGRECRIAEPGFFRLCYTTGPVEAALEGVRRLGGMLNRA